MALAASWVRNSAHLGIAVRLARSNSGLQSFAAKVSGSCLALNVAVVYVSGSCFRVWCGDGIKSKQNHAQHNRIPRKWRGFCCQGTCYHPLHFLTAPGYWINWTGDVISDIFMGGHSQGSGRGIGHNQGSGMGIGIGLRGKRCIWERWES